MEATNEVLKSLQKLIDYAGGLEIFCEKTSTQKGGINNYLKGTLKAPTVGTLLRYAQRIFTPAFRELVSCEKLEHDGKLTSVFKEKLLKKVGIYAFFDSAFRLIYVGRSSTNLFTEIKQRLGKAVSYIRNPVSGQKVKFADVTAYISVYAVERGDKDFIHDLEALILRLSLNVGFNTNKGNFKRQA